MLLLRKNPSIDAIAVPAERPELTRLREHGVLLLRNVFSGPEVRAIRERVELVVERAFREGRHAPVEERHPGARSIEGDLLGMRELREVRHVLLDPRVVRIAKALLGETVTYFGDSAIRVGRGGRGFHKDFVDPEAPPTRGTLRFVFYLQDHSRTSGGLKVRLGSHRFVSRHLGTMMNVPTRLGDLAVFYLRASHTGHNVRLRALPELCLHPKLENLVPRFLHHASSEMRICMLWTFAEPGAHIDRYLSWITREPERWRRSGYSPELVELAAEHGVTLLRAIPEHGSDSSLVAACE
jgi:hypothetical protein